MCLAKLTSGDDISQSAMQYVRGFNWHFDQLNQRFNPAAVLFLQHILFLLLKQKEKGLKTIHSEYARAFSRIRILDSTTFQLPDVFSSYYVGSGGCSHTSGVKIQLEYDLHSGRFLHLYTGHGKENDKTYGTECLGSIAPKGLFIRDLGYFDLEDLHTIHEGESCPYPKLYTLEAIQKLDSAKVLEVIADCPQSFINVPEFAKKHGHKVVSQIEDGTTMYFYIEVDGERA